MIKLRLMKGEIVSVQLMANLDLREILDFLIKIVGKTNKNLKKNKHSSLTSLT